VAEVGRVQDNGVTFDIAGMAAWYGMELSRLAIEHCLPQIPRKALDSDNDEGAWHAKKG